MPKADAELVVIEKCLMVGRRGETPLVPPYGPFSTGC